MRQHTPFETWPHRARRWLPDALAVACLLILVLLFFWRFLTPKIEDRVAFPAGDFTDQFYAWRLYEAREFSAGRLPLWNPYYNSGHPFLADAQSAVFYPVGLAVTLLASRNGDFPIAALQWEAFLHFFLAGTFTYFFVRRLLGRAEERRSREAEGQGSTSAPSHPRTPARFGALVAAVTFMFGGYLTSYPPLQLDILETITWLPLVLLCLDVAAERGTLPPFLAAGIALAMAALAGHSQTLLFILYVIISYYVFRVAGASSVPRPPYSLPSWVLQRGLGLGLTLLVAFGLAAVQLLPALEYAPLSTRAALDYGASAKGLPLLDLLQMVLPGSVSAFASPLYVGILSLWLAIAGVAAGKNRQVIFWAALALLALLIAFGGYSFLYGIFYLFVPGFALFRGQERTSGIVSFALAVLAGYGAYTLVRPLSRPQKRAFLKTHRLLVWAPFGGLVLTLAFFYATRSLPQPGQFIFLVDRAALMTLIFILCAAVVALRLWGWLKPPWIRVLAILLILFDLFTINWYNNQGQIHERFPVTPLIQTLQADPSYRVAGDALPGHFGVVYGLDDLRGISPLCLQIYDDLLRSLPEDRLWSLLNVRYLVAKGRTPPAGSQVALQEGDTALYRLAEPLPRAWITGRVVVETDKARTLALMASPGFDPRQTVLLATPPIPALPPEGGGGTTSIAAYGPERLVVEAEATADSFLVLSEVYFPGWRAWLDGQETPIYRADHALRAVFLPAGAHRLEMVYEPLSFRLGAAISLITLLAVVIGLVWRQGFHHSLYVLRTQ